MSLGTAYLFLFLPTVAIVSGLLMIRSTKRDAARFALTGHGHLKHREDPEGAN